MEFDSQHFGPQAVTDEDLRFAGSRFAEARAAIFANPYYRIWGAPGEPPLPVYDVNLRRALAGLLPSGLGWRFLQAARRSIVSQADLRWGTDRRGFRRILHPNGVCLTGTWQIDQQPPETEYTGYFAPGSNALIIARYSTCCTETRRGRYRSLALVGKLYPTTDPRHPQPVPTADFITQEDIGGAKTMYINDSDLRNAPDVTPWRRGTGLPVLLVTAIVLRLADKQPTIRQLYPIAELGKSEAERTSAPQFMRLRVASDQPPISGNDLDFRDEILAQIYDAGNPQPQRTLTFQIEVADEGTTRGLLVQRRHIPNWRPIGRIVFREAVASYNGDFVLNFQHPPWRSDRNDPETTATAASLRRAREEGRS